MGTKGSRGLAAVVVVALFAAAVWVALDDGGDARDVALVEQRERVEAPEVGEVARPRADVEALAVDAPDGVEPRDARIDVRVVARSAADGVPVEGVDIVVTTPDRFDVVGRTDADGVLAVTLERGAEVKLLARAEAWRSDVVTWGGAQEVVLTLTDGGVIRGHVEMYEEPVADAAVLAVESTLSVADFVSSDQFAHAGRAVRTTTDADGRFVFAGLDPEATYRLTAAAPAAFVMYGQDLWEVEPSVDRDLRISLGRVHGLLVRVVDETGAVPDVDPAFVRGYPGVFTASTRGMPPSPALSDVVGVEVPDEPLTIDLVYLARQRVDELAVMLTVRVIGHEVFEETLALPALSPGEPWPERTVELTRSVDGVAMLEVEVFGGLPAVREPPGEAYGSPVFLRIVELLADGGERRAWHRPLDAWPRHGDVVEIGPLPHGGYEVMIVPGHHLGRFPDDATAAAHAFTLDGDRRVSLNLPDLGVLRVDLTVAGRPYDGRATVHAYDADREKAQVSFRSGPYVLEGLRPGVYEVSGWSSEFAHNMGATVPVEVVAGGVTRLTVPLDR